MVPTTVKHPEEPLRFEAVEIRTDLARVDFDVTP
jgi:hypothetical protein